MKISIIVPTCPAQAEDTFSPKANATFLYPQEYDDYINDTFSTRPSSDSLEGISSGEEYPPVHPQQANYDYDRNDYNREEFEDSVYSDEENYQFDHMQENEFGRRRENKYNHPAGLGPTTEPLSPSSRYNALVVGQTTKQYNNSLVEEDEKQRSNTLRQNIPTSHSASTGAIENHEVPAAETEDSPNDEVYRRLVVFSSPANSGAPQVQHKTSLQAFSFQSVESNNSNRQMGNQSPSHKNSNHNRSYNKVWNPRVPDIEEDEEEEEEKTRKELLSMMENNDMYKAWVMAPLMVAAAKDYPAHIQAKAMQARNKMPKGKKKSVKGITCAAETIENDLFSMINSLWCGMLGPGEELEGDNELDEDLDEGEDEKEGEQEENEEQVPISKLSADLRKQRLRNQVLSHELDIVNKENVEIREQLKERDSEVTTMKLRLQELEDSWKKAETRTIERDMKTALMMNEFLENQLDIEREDSKKKAEDETIERDTTTALMMNEFLENHF